MKNQIGKNAKIEGAAGPHPLPVSGKYLKWLFFCNGVCAAIARQWRAKANQACPP